MANINHTQQTSEPKLVGMKTCLQMVFPDPDTRPGIRTFESWKKKGFIPSIKIGRRVFLDPVKVRRAIEKRFTVEAID